MAKKPDPIDPKKKFAAVGMQRGGVEQDSDWNKGGTGRPRGGRGPAGLGLELRPGRRRLPRVGRGRGCGGDRGGPGRRRADARPTLRTVAGLPRD